mmetsp:Transcript_18601/g.43544  ORF Transcript_18601/g.43544 Transcript_18601/m.43544 type:complete len:357 (-) Transcript_18601:296-1366(-)
MSTISPALAPLLPPPPSGVTTTTVVLVVVAVEEPTMTASVSSPTCTRVIEVTPFALKLSSTNVSKFCAVKALVLLTTSCGVVVESPGTATVTSTCTFVDTVNRRSSCPPFRRRLITLATHVTQLDGTPISTAYALHMSSTSSTLSTNSCAASCCDWPLFGSMIMVTKNTTSVLGALLVEELEELDAVLAELAVLRVLAAVLTLLRVLTERPSVAVVGVVPVLAVVCDDSVERDDDVEDAVDPVDTVDLVDSVEEREVGLDVEELKSDVAELAVEEVDDDVEVCVLEVDEDMEVDVEDVVVDVVSTITTGGATVSTSTKEVTFSASTSSWTSCASCSGVRTSSLFATLRVMTCVTEL